MERRDSAGRLLHSLWPECRRELLSVSALHFFKKKPERKSTPMEIISLREQVNEAKFAAEKARRRANQAAELCQAQESAYSAACARLRELEKWLDRQIRACRA
jgi:hypothetical protein